MDKVKLIILDVDGTLTDGKIYYDSLGNEMKAFNAKDGMAIAQAIKNNVNIAIITGRKSTIVDKRAKELGINHVYQGVHSKVEVLEIILKNLNINSSEVMYIGDDINDIQIMNKVGFTGCPKDAVDEVKNISKIISTKNGGNGAVREIIEAVLKQQGKWASIIEQYIGSCQ